MIRISGFIISLALIFVFVPVVSQTSNRDFQTGIQDDSITVRSLRIGVNVSRPLMLIPEPSRFSIEAVADINIGPEYFIVAESGFAIRDLDEPTYQLIEKGLFLRIGADKNFYKEFNDVVALGARLGFSSYERSSPFISVESDYWDEYSGSLKSESFFRKWAEIVIVLKTELFNNFFIGWNLRGKLLLFDNEDKHMNERYIPGFGSGTTKSAAGFDFYLYYRFPLKF